MPFTEEFLRLKAKYARLYSDSAKANELAYKEAFEKGVITFKDRQFNFKFNISNVREGRTQE